MGQTCVQCKIEFDWVGSGPFCCSVCEAKSAVVTNRGWGDEVCSHCSEKIEYTSTQGTLNKAMFRVLMVLDLEDKGTQQLLLDFRKVCRSFKEITRKVCAGRTPVLSLPQFVSAYAEEFTDFKKDAKNAKTVTARQSARHGYALYMNVVGHVLKDNRNGPAYIEIFAEKKTLFPKSNKTVWANGQLFNPNRVWTPEINDSWAMANIHAKQPFRLMAQVNALANFWDGTYDRPTALGRELIQIWRAGWRPMLVDKATDGYNGYGILLCQSKNADRMDVQADLGSAKGGTLYELKQILGLMADAIESKSVAMPFKLSGVRDGPRLDPDTGHPIEK